MPKKRTMSFFFQMKNVFSHSPMETKSISTAHSRVPYSRGVPSMQTTQEDGNTALIKVSMQPVIMREAPGFPDEGEKSIMSPRGKPQASPDPTLCVPFLSLSLFFGGGWGAMLSLCCWVFSSCSKWVLLFAGVWVPLCGGFSCWGA